ncbi:MAG: polyprenyl synthetase family protein [Bryobacteraceae bacterium]|nr:polyprenyl synthetase family protein [Bryobacteraceae bacterium]
MQTATQTAIEANLLQVDRELVDAELIRLLQPVEGAASPVRDAMRYAVLGRGQRIRPILALRVARLAGSDNELTLRAAAAVEILHCASLVVDDLPCMDNEDERRGRPTTHKVHGEFTALLASFGLVSLSARAVVQQRCSPTELSALIRFQIELLNVLDASGLCEGQDLDLRLTGDERERLRARMIELKTVPLFVLAAQAGLMFTDPKALPARVLRKFAREYGLAFQIVDDYLDGECADFGTVDAQLQRCRETLAPLAPAAGPLEEMVDYLYARSYTRPR